MVVVVGACAGAAQPTTTTAVPATPSSSTTSTTGSTSTTSTSTTTTAPEPEFTATISDATLDRLAHSWTEDCPVGVEGVVIIDLNHWGFDGEVHEGAIVVAREEGGNVVEIFRRLFEIRYPIESVIPIGDLTPGIEGYDLDYNNTSGLHCRRATGSTSWSEHARGLAIDINPFYNPFITSSILWPLSSARYLDRTLDEPAMIHDGDAVVEAFEMWGWLWGGYWESIKDYQHFSTTGR